MHNESLHGTVQGHQLQKFIDDHYHIGAMLGSEVTMQMETICTSYPQTSDISVMRKHYHIYYSALSVSCGWEPMLQTAALM